MATTEESSLQINVQTGISSPFLLEVQPDREADRNLDASEGTSSGKSSTNTLHKGSQSSLSHLTSDINAHFDEKQKSNVNCQDSMSVVRKLSDKLNLAPGDGKKTSENEILSKISEIYSPCTVIISDDSLKDYNTDSSDDGCDDNGRRKQKIKRNLLWIRKELLDLRKKDQIIAQQFMTIRNEIQRLRLLETVEQHKNMLEDIASDAQEEKEYSASSLCDPFGLMQHGSIAPPLLSHVGLTKRDISERRFSLG